MCGIAGIAYDNLAPQFAMTAVRTMIMLQKHRGPDGQGFHDGNGASLGHARLAIIDTSVMGRQPMSDDTGRYWITFNGEIYNYLEIADQLQRVGHHFKSKSDTEVLLTAWLHWGRECIHHFRGMFAFAIWDQQEHQLFAARDRLGIKPFHYWSDADGNLFFSSEIKALLPFLRLKKIHSQLAREYLAWNVLDHDNSQTMLDEVKRLPPGHILTWRPGHGIHITCYWELQAPPNNSLMESADEQQLLHEFRERFEQVIHLHLRSDVPVGTSLSGGLDSSAIVGLVNKQLRFQDVWKEGWQHVFSACFEEAQLDERPYIADVISATGVEPHFVFPTGEKLLTDLGDWIWHQEEPVGGTGTYAQYCVARLAQSHGIKVLLDGQGADEQLAGYRKFIIVFLRELIHRGRYLEATRECLAFFLNPEILSTSRIVDGRRYFMNSPVYADLLWSGHPPERPSSLSLGYSLASRLRGDITRFSLPLLLRYEDRNSMAFGIEARVPFVDHDFVEWLINLPSELRLHNGWTKYILREALKDVLPESVRKRKTKLGFLTPESKWLSGPLKPWLMEMLRTPYNLLEFVDKAGVRQLLLKYQKGNCSPGSYNMLFRLAIFEFWTREFLNSSERYRLLMKGPLQCAY